jgi:hypothetical protein
MVRIDCAGCRLQRLNGWLDNPSRLRAKDVAVVAVFSATVVASDFALAPFVNFKLMDPIVFMVAFVFGFRQGAAVALVSETAWSVVSPWGPAGAVAPFLIAGELLFAVAGWGASKVWGADRERASTTALFIGSTLALCAFAWDFETNAATALIANWPGLTLGEVLGYELSGFVFPVPLAHELGDFLLGTVAAPATLLMLPRLRKRA